MKTNLLLFLTIILLFRISLYFWLPQMHCSLTKSVLVLSIELVSPEWSIIDHNNRLFEMSDIWIYYISINVLTGDMYLGEFFTTQLSYHSAYVEIFLDRQTIFNFIKPKVMTREIAKFIKTVSSSILLKVFFRQYCFENSGTYRLWGVRTRFCLFCSISADTFRSGWKSDILVYVKWV